MASRTATIRLAVIPFVTGAAASAAVFQQFYATALLGLLVGIWSAALLQTRTGAAPPPAPALPQGDTEAFERQQLRLYLDLSPAPLLALDRRRRLHALNREARRMFACQDVLVSPSTALIEAIAASSPGRSTTLRLETSDVSPLFSLTTADLHGGGDIVRVATLVDIDAEMKAAEANALRDLVQVLSHEVSNTLTPIASLSASAAAMLDDDAFDRGALREAIETVARRARGLQRFGEAYRNLARLPAPVRAPADLAALVRDLALLFETQWPQTTLVVTIASQTVRRSVDADQVAQAIWAMLQNAAEIARRVTLDLSLTVNSVVITIGDNGPGIPENETDRVFRPFYTTKPSGSGIGLALARQVCRGHGGDLALTSGKPGQTVFEAVLL